MKHLNLQDIVNYPEEHILMDELSDYLSDTTGYCHFGFEIKQEKDEIIACNIRWDTDGDENIEKQLPKEIIVPDDLIIGE